MQIMSSGIFIIGTLLLDYGSGDARSSERKYVNLGSTTLGKPSSPATASHGSLKPFLPRSSILSGSKSAEKVTLDSRMNKLDLSTRRPHWVQSSRQPPPGICCPPSHFDALEVGPYELSVTRTTVHGREQAFGVQRVAARPSVFYLRNLLSEAECDHLVAVCDAQSTVPSTTAGGAVRSGCHTSWLSVTEDKVASSLTGVVEDLFLSPEATDPEGWGRNGYFENMQVLRYDEGGEFKLHHDANEETPRLITVLLYLNGEGETWFPLAIAEPQLANGSFNPPNRQTVLNAARNLRPGHDGLTVAPSKGDAIAFYNILDDGSGDLDRLAFHAGLPAKAEKRVAALWWRLGQGP